MPLYIPKSCHNAIFYSLCFYHNISFFLLHQKLQKNIKNSNYCFPVKKTNVIKNKFSCGKITLLLDFTHLHDYNNIRYFGFMQYIILNNFYIFAFCL